MPQRAGEITFYEELGVAPDAPPEEIHDSFRLWSACFIPTSRPTRS